MKEQEIFEQFLVVTKIPKEHIQDYRYCTEFYAGFYIEDAIIIQVKEEFKHKYDFNHLVYVARKNESCVNCKHKEKWENEIEYGYPSPCTRCKRRCNDNYESNNQQN